MQPVIEVENLSKQYRLGEVGTGTLSHDLKRWWHKVRGKEDPFARIGEVNDRSTKGTSDYVWALKDIHFSVQPGEVLGIIGRNGAGKSTLLKILSKTTAPTTGRIKVRGRIASLLEVGTGFHPELTGRENIYLNGAILGMTRKEISRKFDEIVDFAGVARYVDTPVKRYSSGMYVRLAFAVAAHLEPEILIVDEVLAVGDAEFQKKCLGKMKDVSVNEGRTVLFVSHNLVALKKICNTGLLLNKGYIEKNESIDNVIDQYNRAQKNINLLFDGKRSNYKNEKIKLNIAKIVSKNSSNKFLINEEFEIIIEFEIFKQVNLNVTVIITTENDEHLLSTPSIDNKGNNYKLIPGKFFITCKIPSHFFNIGIYHFSILFVEDFSHVLMHIDKAFTVEFEEDLTFRGGYLGNWGGLVRPKWDWFLNC